MFRLGTALLSSALLLLTTLTPSVAQPLVCGLPQPAFCDTFDAPSPNGAGTRSGDLDGVVWGTSRSTSNDNPTQGTYYGWNTSHMNRCGTTVAVAPERDVQICNGRLLESVNDNGAVTVLAMYPRQPFDFAGRVGKIAFDVSNDTEGSHTAWPEVLVTDQPVPAPFHDAAGVADFARNSVGVALGAECNNGQLTDQIANQWSVSEFYTTANYQFSTQPVITDGCVNRASGPNGALNHVEVRLSGGRIEVWATDPGATNLKLIAHSDFGMPLTRGLAWMVDGHYNAAKDGSQADHTFAWDNFGFDGPVLPRDLGFVVFDATHNGTTGDDIGYILPPHQSKTFQVTNVLGSDQATAVLVEFTFWPHAQDTMNVVVNGNPVHSVPWQFGSNALTFKSYTLAIPISPSEIRDGTNTLVFSSSDVDFGGVSIANIDLILAGAGGGAPLPAPPTVTNTPTITTVPTGTPTSVATDTPLPTATTVPTDTPTPLATNTPTPTNAPTTVPTDTPTAIPPGDKPTPQPQPTQGPFTPLTCSISIDQQGQVTGSCVQ